MFESILFGGANGFGESLLIKLSEDKYGIIDSFLCSTTKRPKVLTYLEQEKINPDKVDFIILTHYHQDHFCGIADILKTCSNARFFSSSTIAIKSFQVLMGIASNINSRHNYFQDYIDIINVLKQTNRKLLTLTDNSKPIIDNHDIKITALSPNQQTEIFLDTIYKERVTKYRNNTIQQLPKGKDFNFQSIVILIKFKEFIMLYGSDLEYHKSNSNIGWDAIFSKSRNIIKDCNSFKIPHHGSKNGIKITDCNSFLKSNSILTLTPYSRGYTLPQEIMLQNILALSKFSYITSILKYTKLPHPLRKKVKHLNIKRVKGDEGIIHLKLIDNLLTVDSLQGSAIPIVELDI